MRSECPVDYPCAIADHSKEGCKAALTWVVGHLEQGQTLTLWIPQKQMLRSNQFLVCLSKEPAINVVTLRGGFYCADGPVLAMYPNSNEIAWIMGANGITALAVVQWSDDLDTWVKEVGAKVVHSFKPDKTRRFPFFEKEPELDPEVIKRLEDITVTINLNNSIASASFEKDITVRQLLQLHDTGYELPPKRMAQWAAAHGWLYDNPKELANWARKISSGIRPRISQ
ncbi:hypothetical protein PT282_02570 [Bifidobacterium sp. ESL0763]|uniref:hypothetical protein n=1 Tax=Bifidobacterium sp. ESL0763 TaxID=2983227 RepID=UPI0023F74F87|nr:hypothetical protein [Bifidobacterium sp. ESL0763]MDF7663556.1 hypothetical protein [Bifidobacterium sp. ESL0763]